MSTTLVFPFGQRIRRPIEGAPTAAIAPYPRSGNLHLAPPGFPHQKGVS